MNKILKQIIDNDSITIFRHISPDGDAIFSQLAMYDFIKTNFKDKKVKMCGFDTTDLTKYKVNKVSDSFISNSLAIVLDTANKERVDDQRFSTAKSIIKIDHHPNYDEFGCINHVDSTCVAACEVLYDLLTSKDFKNYKMSNLCARYLLSGIITDSLNFKTNNTTGKTFKNVSELKEKYDLDISSLNYELFSNDKSYFEKTTKLRSYAKFDNHFLYLVLNEKDLKKIGFTSRQAKDNIAEFGNIKGINVWAIFAYNNKTKCYDASIRGRNKCIVNKIASKYNGGGHPYAAGVKDLSDKSLKEIIKDLSTLANK